MSRSLCRPRLRRAALALVLGAAVFPQGPAADVPPAHAAQIAGHGTIPSTGPAARDRQSAAPREEDPVLARIESLRRTLADLGKRYKKTKGDERKARAGEIASVLDEIDARLRELAAALPKR